MFPQDKNVFTQKDKTDSVDQSSLVVHVGDCSVITNELLVDVDVGVMGLVCGVF